MPIRSMTGFGLVEKRTPLGLFRVEIRGVNNRYFELQLRLPKSMAGLEQKTRAHCADAISRGSVSVFVSFEADAPKSSVKCDEAMVENYLSICSTLKKKFNLEGAISLSTVLALPDVIKAGSAAVDDKKTWAAFESVLAEGVADYQSSREAEGSKLLTDIKKRCKDIKGTLKLVEKRAPNRLTEYRDELKKRISQLLESAPDPDKIASEVAFMADRMDIAEECTRLSAHTETFLACFVATEPVGKRMNFLLQEMNREANTIGSKANDLEISQHAMHLKETIEQIREQIQNLE